MIARKHNPGFLSDDELVGSFCVRTVELASLVETLRECSGSANTHQIVIGPRGSGKTTLLLRVVSEVRRDTELASRFFPVVFAEESYQVSTAGEFWLECLSRLADQAPRGENDPDLRLSFGELREIRDDRLLGDRCLGVLQDFANREDRRLVLVVENLNMMFRDMADAAAKWRLRHVLQTEPRIVLLASATSRFEGMDDPEEALYQFLRVLFLRPLGPDDCAVLWRSVSGRRRDPQTIRALRILTGGNPRLLTAVARFGARLSFRELMADLLDLVDDHTEYFRSHLDALPAQERRVYLALAELWKPATAREIAGRARLDTSKCSAQLARLTDRGAVEVTGGTARRKLYCLAERLYNVYYLMRRARGPAPLVEALIRFMEGYYRAHELKALAVGIAREASETGGEVTPFHRIAFEKLVDLPSLEAHRDELLSLAPPNPALAGRDGDSLRPATPASRARELFENGHSLAKSGLLQEALAPWDELVRRFGRSDAPDDRRQVSLALAGKGKALRRLGRAGEALAVWDDIERRFGGSRGPAMSEAVAHALLNKGVALSTLNRAEEALTVWNELTDRYGASGEPAILKQVAGALVGKSATLVGTGRPEEALAACDTVLRRFGSGEGSTCTEEVSVAFANKIFALVLLNRSEEGLAVCEEAVERFRRTGRPVPPETLAGFLVSNADLLARLNRAGEAVAIWNEVVRRFGKSDDPPLRHAADAALLGLAEHELARGGIAAATEHANRVLHREADFPEGRWLAHLLRARARLAEGDETACVRDVEAGLGILPVLGFLPKEALDALSEIAVDLGPAGLRDLVRESPASDLLLPFTTALERELGLEPGAAWEVEEVARDIRRDLEARRRRRENR